MDQRAFVEKLSGPEDWAKWQKGHIFRANALESIVYGTCLCPQLGVAPTNERKIEVEK